MQDPQQENTVLKSSRLCLVSFRNCFLNVAQDPRQENTMLKIQGVYDELKELYPSQRRSGLTLAARCRWRGRSSSTSSLRLMLKWGLH